MTYRTCAGGSGVPEGYGASLVFVNGRSTLVGSVGALAKKIIDNTT